jgi:hypothetical protein
MCASGILPCSTDQNYVASFSSAFWFKADGDALRKQLKGKTPIPLDPAFCGMI